MSNAAKNLDILTTGLSILHNYFYSSTKLLFWSVSSENFRSFSKTVLFVQWHKKTFKLWIEL